MPRYFQTGTSGCRLGSPVSPGLVSQNGGRDCQICHSLVDGLLPTCQISPVVARGASFRQPCRQCPPGASEAKSGKASQSNRPRRPPSDLMRFCPRMEVVVCAAAGLTAVPPWRSAMTEKVTPDPEDYAQVQREYGRLSYHATIEEQAEHYRLAQCAKLVRLYRQGKLPPELAQEMERIERKITKPTSRSE